MVKLTKPERARIAAKYDAVNSIVEVQVWWGRIKGRNVRINPKTIKHWHRELIRRLFGRFKTKRSSVHSQG